jgi:AraC-like DNA-binding protein
MSISSTVVHRADIRFHTAAPELQPYVGCFWIITAERGATVRVVPDGTSSIAIERREDGGFDGYLRGPLLEPLELKFEAPTTLIGVRLRPGVAFNLTGIATHALVNRRARFHEYAALRELASIEPVPRTASEWIGLLQRFLIGRLAGTNIHPLIAKALAEIHAEQGNVSVAELAARCGASERNLARLMRDWLGYGAKRYAGIVRFQSTLAQMERAPDVPVAMLATDIGYFDQSHLTVEMTRFAGASPGRLISDHVSDFSKTRCDVPY